MTKRNKGPNHAASDTTSAPTDVGTNGPRMTGNSEDIQWYIARDGQQHGPLTDAEMRVFIDNGYLRPTDLIWRPGFTDWRAAPIVFPARPTPAGASPIAANPMPAPAAGNPYPGSRPEAASAATAAATNQINTAIASARPATSVTAPSGGPRTAASPANQRTSGELVTAGRTANPRRNGDQAAPGDAGDERRSGGKRLVLAALLLALIMGSTAYVVTHRNEIFRLVGIADKPDAPLPVVKAEATTTAALQSPGDAARPEPPPTQAAATAIATPAADHRDRLDSQLQKSRLWSYMKQSYPDWYNERVGEVAKLAQANKPERDLTRHMVEALVALRRRHAEYALKADTARLRSIASAFLTNLRSLSEAGPDVCYGFISQGEASAATIEIFHHPERSAALEAQAVAIFDAVAAGRSTPQAHDRPKKEDYDVLARELGKLGWSQADLQLFADPKALAKAEPARVCKMVRDWFKAHVSISDQSVQERLLFETLRPVVAG